jgi:hypothetical protein
LPTEKKRRGRKQAPGATRLGGPKGALGPLIFFPAFFFLYLFFWIYFFVFVLKHFSCFILKLFQTKLEPLRTAKRERER